MKIISTKEHQRLKNVEEKYNFLIGQTITLYTGCRSRYGTLLSMSKEELVHRYMDLHNYTIQLQKKLKDSDINE